MVESYVKRTNLVSWNTKGLNHYIKLGKVLTHLADLSTDIALLQETHLISQDAAKLKQKWVGQAFLAGYNNKSRGVAILIHKDISFQVEKL